MRIPIRVACWVVLVLLTSTPIAAQGTLQPTDPASGVAFYDTYQQAQSLYDAGRFDAAEPLLASLTRQAPDDGTLWLLLARARQRLGESRGAISAYLSSLEHGNRSQPWTPHQVARLYAGLGESDSALVWLERSLASRWDDRPGIASDTAFRALQGDPRFVRITGISTQPVTSREEGWRRDIDYLVAEAKRMHASPTRPAFSAEFDSVATSLKARVGELSDDRIVLELARLVTMLGDGHSGIYGPGPDSPLRLAPGSLPLQFYEFAEGLFVIDAVEGERDWVGAQVLRFGDLPASEVLSALPLYIHHDNAMGAKWLGVRYTLPSLAFLHTVGATDDPDQVTLTLRSRDGREHRVPLQGGSHAMAFPTKLAPAPGAPQVPLYLSQPDSNYRLLRLPERNAVYFQFNQVRDRAGGPTLAQFADSLHQMLERTDARHLIIDVRQNNGGNNGLLGPLIRTLVWWENEASDHRIYVLTGRNTFSAAQNFINRVERLTDAIFVGEPSSSRPNFTGEETNLTLPYSGIRGSISTLFWQDSDPSDARRFIAPDVPVFLAAGEFFAGLDPALEAIFTLIDRGETSAR